MLREWTVAMSPAPSPRRTPAEHSVATLRVTLLGDITVRHGDESAAPVTRAGQALLAYLMLQRRRLHPRAVLAGVFWGDQSEDSARGCLNTALWRLRRALEPGTVRRGAYLIQRANGDVGFNANSAYWLDVEVLEETAQSTLGTTPADGSDDDAARLGAAVACYTGDLLEGFYADWMLRERERLRLLHLDCLTWLMRRAASRHAHDTAIAWGQQIVRHDALREEVHRELMRLYAASGRRADGLRQFETCRTVLARELDAEPTDETRALRAQLVGPRRADPLRAAARPESQPMLGVLRELAVSLEETGRLLRKAIAQLESAMGDGR
jgi:DNA-binding SARP family transcriptional activator